MPLDRCAAGDSTRERSDVGQSPLWIPETDGAKSSDCLLTAESQAIVGEGSDRRQKRAIEQPLV